MLAIQGYSSGNGAEVAANTNALRVSERPMNVGAYGSYSASLASGIMAAGLAGAAPILSLRSAAASGPNCLIKRLTFEMGVLGTAFTAGQTLFNLFVARAFTASDIGGGALTVTTNNLKKRTSFAGTATQDLRVSATATLTAGTRTLDASPIASIVVPVPATTVSTILVPIRDLIRAGPSDWPFVLAPNEGLVLQATVPATGTWCFGCNIDWDEVASTEI
jgi:hypothetical protein